MPPRGYKQSPEAKAKISAAKKGHPVSEETRAKIAAKLRGRKAGPHSEETKAKISAAQKGKSRGKLSKEHRAKLSAAKKGKPLSDEHKAALSASRKGHWTKERVGYIRAHNRLGPVSELICCDCGKQAQEWAFKHDAVGEVLHDDRGRPYSLDPRDYQPMCRVCHKRFDRHVV